VTTPPHGNRRRYHTPYNCRCPQCTRAKKTYDVRRKTAMHAGRWQPYTDTTNARRYLQRLTAAGASIGALAELTGCDHETITLILHGQVARIRTATEQRILAARFDPAAVSPTLRVNAAGSRRRIQALTARGWAKAALADRLGVAPANLSRSLRQEQVTARYAAAVRALYAELWDADPVAHGVSPVAAKRARLNAARREWRLPMAWDDDTIDDPDAEPADPEPETDPVAALMEDTDELLAQGCTLDQAARRPGVSSQTLYRHRAATGRVLRRAS